MEQPRPVPQRHHHAEGCCVACGTRLLPTEQVCWKCGVLTAEGYREQQAAAPPPRPAPLRTPRQCPLALPLRAHLIVSLIVGCLGFLGGWVGAIVSMMTRDRYDLEGGIIFGLWLLGGLIGPHLLFTYVMPARCPTCRGPLRVARRAPVTYRCDNCFYEHRSAVDASGGLV